MLSHTLCIISFIFLVLGVELFYGFLKNAAKHSRS